MAYTTFRLDYILSVANCVDFDDESTRISRVLFEHYDQLTHYNLTEVLDILHISKQAFSKYYKKMGFNNYTELKDDATWGTMVRKKQIIHRYKQFNIDKTVSIMNQLLNSPIDMALVDKICDDIYCSDRVIFYGSPTLLQKIFDFQIDMKVFHKTVLTSSVCQHTMLVPDENDLLFICSATGLLVKNSELKFKDSVLNSSCKKILVTKDKDNHYPYQLFIDTDNDYYEMHYIYLLYLDLIKTRYYEKYIKE